MNWALGWVLLGFVLGLLAGRGIWFSKKVCEEPGTASIEGGKDDGQP